MIIASLELRMKLAQLVNKLIILIMMTV